VVVEGPAKTGTVSLSRITVENGQVKSTVVKAKTFTGNNFADPTFIEASLDAGRYQINVEVKSGIRICFHEFEARCHRWAGSKD